MNSYTVEQFLGDGMSGARRTTLFSLYQNVPPNEIEEDVAAVKTMLFQSVVEKAKIKNSPLYDSQKSLSYQTRLLVSTGYPQMANQSQDEFEKTISRYLSEISNIPKNGDYNFPYIVVVPSLCVSIKNQLSAIHTQSFLDESDFTILRDISLHNQPYIITDVGAGEMSKGMCVNHALQMLASKGRTPLLLEEIIALILQTREDILNARRNPWNLFRGSFPADFPGCHKTANKPRLSSRG